MNIRLLQPSDAEKYWELRLEALKQNPEAFATSYEEAMNRKNPIEITAKRLEGNYTFGAFNNDELVGMVTLLQETHLKLRHKAHILAMYVSPKIRGAGAGEELLSKAIEQAKEMKEVEQLNLAVVTTNEKAKGLYKKAGFKTFGMEEKAMKHNGIYYDEEYMALTLKN
ncbi:GNAT family N-acetyltransferase [Virgibacillus doumboii]|uniref:GNAT family N-acetyltransferase n=1 Tax=Virgibacillus doumboii TaxID=2697503 RepID=UPI0013DEFED3|nr:GNAT family N-acetyltransferase [Virgibacillus doumboii]